jgi:hypothetical protein
MEDRGVDGIKVDGTNYVPSGTTYAQVQDSDEFIKWAEENDSQLIEEKPRKELLNQLVRTYLDDGKPLPPGVGFYIREYVSTRAA